MKTGQRLTCVRQRYILLMMLLPGSFSPCYSVFARQVRPGSKKLFSATDTLQEVQVKGIRTSLRNASPTPVQRLSGERLEKLSSLSVADAMRYFSGVQLKDYGGIGGLKTINVRSLGSNHTAVFYDGIQLGNAQNGQTDLGKFSLDNIETIELYNAQKSSVFQPARGFAAGASLYLQSKTPVFDDGKKDAMRASFKTGSFALINPALRWQHKLSDKISSSFSTEWLRSDGKYKFRYTNSVYDTTATRQNGDIEALRIEGALYGTLADSSKWSVKVFQYLSDRGLPHAIVSNRFESDERQRDRNTFIQSSFRKTFERYDLMLNVKYAYDYQRYLDPVYDNIEGSLNNRYRQQEYYVSVANRYRITGFWDAALSADLIINKLDANIYHFSYPTRYTRLAALASSIHTGRLTVQTSLLGSFVSETVKEYSPADAKREFTPAVTASWQPFKQHDLFVRAFYKSIFRMPTFNDLYYTFVGNTALEPEYTRQYDAGFTFTPSVQGSFLKHLSLQTDVYYNEITDKIVAVPGENLFRWRMMNLGKVEIKGLESTANAAVALGNALSLNASLSYTFQQALDVTSPSDFNYRHQIPYTPEHSGALTFGAEWKNSWLSYSYLYTGERYSQKANIAENYMEPWYTHDISASHRIVRSNKNYQLTAEVNNVFNQYRDIVLNFPMPGRSFRFTIIMDY